MVSGIIMASGFSKRMGRDKLLMQIDQVAIVEKVIRAAVESSLNEVIIVYRQESVKAIASHYNIKTVKNKDAQKGQSASVIKGVNAADPATDAFLFMVGDQPFLNSGTINYLLACQANHPEHIIVPTYDGHKGSPVLFPSSFKNELLKIQGDKGGKTVIDAAGDRVNYVQIEQANIGLDVDTPEDLSRIK